MRSVASPRLHLRNGPFSGAITIQSAFFFGMELIRPSRTLEAIR